MTDWEQKWQLTARHGTRRGASWIIRPEPLLLGRSRKCDIVIQDPAVSREHCRIHCDAAGVYLEALTAHNAPLVNGRPVNACTLHVNDHLAVGSANFVLSPATPAREFDQRSLTRQSTIYPRGTSADSQDSQWIEPRPRSLWDLDVLHRLVLELPGTASEAECARAVIRAAEEGVSLHRCSVVRYECPGSTRFAGTIGF